MRARFTPRLSWLFGLLFLASQVALGKDLPPLPVPIAQNLPIEVILEGPGLDVQLYQHHTGGLIGGMVVSGYAQTNEIRIAPLRARFADYDFKAKFERAIRATLASERVSPNATISILPKAWSDAEAHERAKGSNNVYLAVRPFYGFDGNFNALRVSMQVWVTRVAPKSNGKYESENLLYRTLEFSFPMAEVRNKPTNSGAWRWDKIETGAMKQMLDEGIAQVNAMLAYELSAEGAAEYANGAKDTKFKVGEVKMKGKQLRMEPDWYWYRPDEFTILGARPLAPLPEVPKQ